MEEYSRPILAEVAHLCIADTGGGIVNSNFRSNPMDIFHIPHKTKRKSAPILGAVAVLAFCVLGSATAHAGWLQKGKDLINDLGLGKSDQLQLTSDEISAGLKEALRVGTATVVGQLGRDQGFSADPVVHIPLPESLETVQSALGKVGMSSLLDNLELRLNQAAEAATPKAKELFWQAIGEMTLADVNAIYKGPDDAATRYFQGKMSQPLAEMMRPIVHDSLADVGAVKAYENVMGTYRSLPFTPEVNADLTGHVVRKGMDGIFYYLAREEAQIRKNPAKRTTELLKRVFGTNKQ